ncbi:uncharacterized protein Bfra_001632 [Botrytis fragariae]|uniref:Uncharacterized protein n=1 Tax=Botrytis fragariae TaxID=1964551 RepID=A0A8H6B0X6_9HELO|nr:uncharacterized protein Bfra_001632 [Botrytis fragariae]KAF5877266.1 hypothetical protein Bfra_001632 [Botrytis fragariae]
MPSHHTYNKDKTTRVLKRDLEGKGKYDADGHEITTYRVNSKGKLNGKEVTKYKYCKEEDYYRLDANGKLGRDEVDSSRRKVKKASTTSNLTAGIEQQRAVAQREGDRDRRLEAAEARQPGSRAESSRTSTGGGSGGQPRTASRERRRRQSPSGQTLTAEQIERQTQEEVEATARFHEPGVFTERQPPVGSQNSSDRPPSYGNHKKDYIDRQIAGPAEGPRNANAPPFSDKPLSAPGPTGQTPKLGKRVSRDTRPQATFGGRYDPAAPPNYSSDEPKRGNESITSGSDGAGRGYPSGSDDIFKWSSSEDQKSSGEKGKPKSVPEPKGTSKRGGSSKATEPTTTKKSSAGKAPTNSSSMSRPLSGDSSMGDTESSPRKSLAQQGRSRTEDRGFSKRESSKRETSEERRRGKLPVRTKEDPAKGSSSRRHHESSDPDSLYGS